MKQTLKSHLRKKYYKADKKIIVLHVDKENDLYNPYDITKETISESVTEYLEMNAETLMPLSEVTIAIDSPDEIDLRQFKRAMQLHYGISILNSNRILKIIRKKCIYLFVAAVVSLILASIFENIGREIFVFVGTLAIWELADFFIFRDEKDMITAYIYEVLQDSKVIKNNADK